jgi:hypothetical protein
MFKELKKLANEIDKASTFAQALKAQVDDDLAKLATLRTTLNENMSFLQEQFKTVNEASEILEKLNKVLQ